MDYINMGVSTAMVAHNLLIAYAYFYGQFENKLLQVTDAYR